MKIVFMGTPALAVPFVEKLRESHEIVLVVTQPDKPQGRGRETQMPPLKKWANEYSIPVSQPVRARDESFIEEMRTYAPDAIAVVAYGQILPNAILEMPRLACLNAHFSLLPRWRGAAPVQHSLLHDDAITGVTIQHMAQKLDAGDVVSQVEYLIPPDATTGDLWRDLTPIGAQALSDALKSLENGTATRTPQDETQITLAPQLSRDDGRVNWQEGATQTVNRIRATNPWPGAWLLHKNQNLKVWRARVETSPRNESAGTILEIDSDGIVVATNDGTVRVLEVQGEGRPRMDAASWARGQRIERAQKLGDD